jgi:hypothetical protein
MRLWRAVTREFRKKTDTLSLLSRPDWNVFQIASMPGRRSDDDSESQ